MAILTVKMIPQQNRVLKLIFFFPFPRRKFSAATNGTCEEESTEKVGAWDFVEHSQRSYCSCSR